MSFIRCLKKSYWDTTVPSLHMAKLELGKRKSRLSPCRSPQWNVVFLFRYTMQGDLGITPLGNPVAGAGMIPRVLVRLFSQLEESGADYSVKISYIELYNEELRDLLASDLAAPMGNSQPMSMGSGSSRDVAAGGLKIFDDTSKRGVLIQ